MSRDDSPAPTAAGAAPAVRAPDVSPLEIVLITGMSGSGKSVALHALEDAGYYCVDNLPPELLQSFAVLEQQRGASRVAVAMDVRSASSLPQVPALLQRLRDLGVVVRCLFLDATTDTLVRRYSETRRRHPLSATRDAAADAAQSQDDFDQTRALVDAIELERELLGTLREQAHVIDTSMLRASGLQARIKSLLAASTGQLTLVFESFAFKRGIPVDADFVFDVRMLPNPHYEPALRDLTGRDEPVAAFLRGHPEVDRMATHIRQFLDVWLDPLARDHRSYVTVAVGCTGGQHRSVYMVELLSAAFAARWTTLKRHRELG